MKRRPLIAGNWKMNGRSGDLVELVNIAAGIVDFPGVDTLICPPFTLLGSASTALGEIVALGAQDCHHSASGAHTGDISPEMLADSGCSHVLTGHSERRADHGESDATVLAKTEAAWRAGLVAVVCIGETETEREKGTTLEVLGRQIEGSVPDGATHANTVVAYEPVWAIGTGRTPTTEDVKLAHAFIRKTLELRFGEVAGAGFRLLYGGSVKAANAAELMGVENVDGALVGGASLKAKDFIAICAAVPAS